MITFKNRYAEFDNLDDSYNENVFKNCYNKEYRKNFLNFNNHKNRNENSRYLRGQNFNDMRLNNNNINSYQRQISLTPFPQLPIVNNNYSNNSNNDFYRQQNFLGSRSSPNMPSIIAYNNNNQIRTPIPRYNNNNFNNENGFISNNYDTNLSSDSIQFYNDNNILNISNDSQYNQDQSQNILNSSNQSIRQSWDNELEELQKERKLLLEQEKLNQLDFELRYLRQKRKADLERRLAEQQQNLIYINKLKENEIENIINNNNRNNTNLRSVNTNYRINTFRNSNRPINNKILEESLKTSVMNDKFYMNELIQEINRMKISQQEANFEFQKKMKDLVKQNESIKLANQKMIQKIKDMKRALSDKKDKKQNDDDDEDFIYNNYDDYLIEQRNNRIKQKQLFDNNNGYENNSKSYNFTNKNKYSNINNDGNFRSLNVNDLGKNKRKIYLGKKDEDIEEFNSLNKNLINTGNNVVVTPLLFKENKNKYNKNYDFISPLEYSQKTTKLNHDGELNKNKSLDFENDYSGTRKQNLYSLIRKNNGRLERIKEIEEKN